MNSKITNPTVINPTPISKTSLTNTAAKSLPLRLELKPERVVVVLSGHRLRQRSAVDMKIKLASWAPVDEAGAHIATRIAGELPADVRRGSDEDEGVFWVRGVVDLRREGETEVVEVEFAFGLCALVGGAGKSELTAGADRSVFIHHRGGSQWVAVAEMLL